jgi:hypothetical protein
MMTRTPGRTTVKYCVFREAFQVACPKSWSGIKVTVSKVEGQKSEGWKLKAANKLSLLLKRFQAVCQESVK